MSNSLCREEPAVQSANHVTDDEITAVEAALRKIDYANLQKHVFSSIPKWFLVLELFKDLELGYTCLADKTGLAAKYRAVLTSVLGMGEMIVAVTEDTDESSLAVINYSRENILCNVSYLRDKYEQWFVERDPQVIADALEAINNAGTGTETA